MNDSATEVRTRLFHREEISGSTDRVAGMPLRPRTVEGCRGADPSRRDSPKSRSPKGGTHEP